MTVREAFKTGTEAFNAHDIGEFAGLLADDGVFRAPGGQDAERNDACDRLKGWLSGIVFG